MQLEKVDLFLLHSQLIEDDFRFFKYDETREASGTTLSCYFNAVIPAFEKLKQEGKISHWGIGLGQEEALIKAINSSSFDLFSTQSSVSSTSPSSISKSSTSVSLS